MAEEGDGIDLAYHNSKERRGRLQKGSCNTLQTADTLGVVVRPIYYRSTSPPDSNKFYGRPVLDDDENAPTCRANSAPTAVEIIPSLCHRAMSPSLPNSVMIESEERERDRLVIRKLTEREYWRLMGQKDADFDKALAAVWTQYIPRKAPRYSRMSKSQLYKLAGNSIVVPVLESTFRELLTKKQPTVRLLSSYSEEVTNVE